MSQAARRVSTTTLTIGEVIDLLRPEFPDATISKIRFLEGAGLISPERTHSGYRAFAPADVERLRAILRLQRDHYLPLKVIRERLEESSGPDATPAARPADFRPGGGRVRMQRGELADALDEPEALVDELAAQGLVTPLPTGHFDEDAYAVVAVIARLAEFGIQPRHLRAYRAATDRDAGLIQQAAGPYRHRSAEQADEVTRELAALLLALRTSLLRTELVQGVRPAADEGLR